MTKLEKERKKEAALQVCDSFVRIIRFLYNVLCNDYYEKGMVNAVIESTIGDKDHDFDTPLETDYFKEEFLCRTDKVDQTRTKLLRRNVLIKTPHKKYCLNLSGIALLNRSVYPAKYVKRDRLTQLYKDAVKVMQRGGVVNSYILYVSERKRLQCKKSWAYWVGDDVLPEREDTLA